MYIYKEYKKYQHRLNDNLQDLKRAAIEAPVGAPVHIERHDVPHGRARGRGLRRQPPPPGGPDRAREGPSVGDIGGEGGRRALKTDMDDKVS